jgi:hypothetical protein
MAEGSASPFKHSKIFTIKQVMDKLKPHKPAKTEKKGTKQTLFYTTDKPTEITNLENSPKIQLPTNIGKNDMVSTSKQGTTLTTENEDSVTIRNTLKKVSPELFKNSLTSVNNAKPNYVISSVNTEFTDSTPKNVKRNMEAAGLTPMSSKIANTNTSKSSNSSSSLIIDSDAESIDMEHNTETFKFVIHDKIAKKEQEAIANKANGTPNPTQSPIVVTDSTHAMATDSAEPQLILFVKGTNQSIVSLIQTKPSSFRSGFCKIYGSPKDLSIQYRSDCIKIQCENLQQYHEIQKTTSMHGIEVEVSLPRIRLEKDNYIQNTYIPTNQAEKPINKVVIHRVHTELSIEEIVYETAATTAIRISRKDNSSTIRVPTQTVILSFISSPPQFVNIGFQKYKTEPYIPNPMRCDNCQNFGHSTSKCKINTITCSYCTQNHGYQNCPTKQQHLPALCKNCGGPHSSAFNQCPKYLEVKSALTIRATQHITYKQALTQIKSNSTTSPTVATTVSSMDTISPQALPTEQTTSTGQQQYKAIEQTILHVAPGLTDLLVAFTHTLTQIIQQLPASHLHTSLIQQLNEATNKFTAQPIAFTSTITSNPQHISKQYSSHPVNDSTPSTVQQTQTQAIPQQPQSNYIPSLTHYPPLSSNHGYNT